ncbi:right-handed parallel beta-helix repeat-containing protein [Cohnella fermenti]|uniref:DUF1565 domain-containing protein n=1 Tax=Cohnella fermenti TaxID=2565925 RepID=A0A4S4C911_9BACL|nr:right-handed parallel beta-helix repeat-containing protein [Cohnella fermenti]THF84484.1 DUF1565 domain-containing protein [Cohnella fermenti]
MKQTFDKAIAVLLMAMIVFSLLPQGVALADGTGGRATYYVSNDGDDANSGGAGSPFQSLSRGVAQLQPGDTLVIQAGEYSEALVVDGLSGTAQAPITIRGEDGANITASAYVNAPFWKNFTLSVTNSEYVNIVNLNLTFGGTPTTGDSYTVGISNAKHVSLQNNYLNAGSPAYAVFYLNTNNENLVLDGNYIEGSDNAFYGYGINNTTVTNNIFTEWWAFHFESSTSTNNVISNNVFAGTGEHFYGGAYANSTITNNIFLGNPTLTQDSGNTISHNSVISESYKTSAEDVVASATELFVSASDYHLKDGSPAIDAGTSTGMPQYDREGSVRYGTPDIGAYTYGKVYYLDGSAAPGGDGLSESTAFSLLTEANTALEPGATLLIRPGTYSGNLSISGTGTSDTKPIAIRKMGQGTVQINGGSSPALSLVDIANVTVDGLYLMSSGNSALLADGLINGDITNSTFTTAVHGIEITGGTSGSKIHSNTFKQVDQKGILLKDSAGNQIYNNIFDNYKNILNEGGSFTNTLIMNNVFISHYGDGSNIILKGTDTGNTIANNIFQAEGALAIQAPVAFYEATADNMVDYNLYDSTSYGLSGGTPANEINSVYGNPLFASAADYHLQSGSAAINRGTNANAPAFDRDGNVRFGTTDIGAYEYAGDSSAFYVVSQSPQGSGNSVQSKIDIVLSEPATNDNGNIANNLTITTTVDGNQVLVPGGISATAEGAGIKITFTPASALNYDATYTVQVKKDLMSTNGNYLPADVVWSFSTEAFIMSEYYISPNGSDANLGTIDSPKRTVSSGLIAKLKAGDTVYFREGTYNGVIVLQSYSGTADKPITFRSYPNEKAVLTSDHSDYIIYLGHSQNIRIEGLTFAPNASQNGSRGPAIRIDNHTAGGQQSAGLVVTGNRFVNCGTAIATRDLVNVGYGDFEFSNNVILSNDSWGLYFQEVRVKEGSYGKIFDNVIYGASRSLNLWGKSSNLLFYNNTFADTYDAVGGSGRFDVYPVQGTYDAAANPINISTNLVFKNNIFTKPIRTQLEGGKSIIDASQNVVFDNNVYSINGTQRVTYNYGGEGPTLTLSELQSGTSWANQGRPLETNGISGEVTFVDTASDARIIFGTNPAIGAADSTIIPGVTAPATDINGNLRTRNEAGAFAFDQTFAFVGANDGVADGSPLRPYPSIGAAIDAGAKSIQVMAGSYEDDETINMATSTGEGDVKIESYNGEVILRGAVQINGTAGKSVTLQGLTLIGDLTLAGSNIRLDSNHIQGSVTLNQANGAEVVNNIFAPAASVAIGISNTDDSSIANNVITGRTTAIQLSSGSQDNKIYNNTLYGNTKDVAVSGNSANNAFRNNIFSTKIDSYSDNEFDYNLYNADTIGQADLNAVSEAHAVKASAQFINAKANDFRIYKQSPAMGSGIMDSNTPSKDINGNVRNTPVDIGAYAVAAIQVTYYVDGLMGDDANSGTQDAPFATIAAALNALRNGETVIVNAGTYNEDITLINRSGQNAGEYVIQANGKVVLNGVIALNNATGVTIEGFTVNAGSDADAVTLSASPRTSLNQLTITGAKSGIHSVNSSELFINKASIQQVDKGIILEGTGASTASITQSAVDRASVRAIEAGTSVSLTMNTSVITRSAEGVSGTNADGLFLFNNTFYDNTGYSISADAATELRLANNIYSRSGSWQGSYLLIGQAGQLASDYNLYDAGENEKIVKLNGNDLTLAEFAANSVEQHGQIGDPDFQDAVNGNYKLAKGSAAARNGAKVVGGQTAPDVDLEGTAYSELGQDIGAYYSPYSMKTLHLAGDNVGSLTGDGSAEHPFRTFAQAIDAADSGDTIIVHKGIYSGRYDIVDKHGVADAPIVIKASADPNDPLDMANASLPGPIFTSKTNYQDRDEEASAEVMTQIANSSYLTIEGLDITGFRGAGIWTMNSDHLTLRNLNIWDIDTPQDITSGVQGLLVNYTTNSLFQDIRIWDIGQTRKSQADHGAYIGHSSDLVFDRMKVSDSPGGGMQFYSGDNYEIQATDVVIKNSVFSESKYGLILVGIQGFTITNNTFYNSWSNDLYLDWNVRDNLFQNNIFYNDRTEEYDSVDGQVKPVIVGYQYNVVRTNPDQSTTDMVVNNTFRNNMYDYKTFSASAQFRFDVKPIAEFMLAENAAATNNRYSKMFAGEASFKGSLVGSADDYEEAERIFDGILDLNDGSEAIDQGVLEFAPISDILGRNRVGMPDLGAYENPNGGSDNGSNNGNNGNNNNGNGGSAVPSAGTIAAPSLNADTGVASANMSSQEMAEALKSASAGENGEKSVLITLPFLQGATAYSVELPNPVEFTADAVEVVVSTAKGTVAIPSSILGKAGQGRLTLSIGSPESSVDGSPDGVTVILMQGGSPVSLSAGNSVSDKVKVWVPYTLTAEQLNHPESIAVWRSDSNGNKLYVPSAHYDAAAGAVVFEAEAAGSYWISDGYKTFNDIVGINWAKGAVEALASKGIISGVSADSFAPAEPIRRGDFVALLVRALGLHSQANDNFIDVKPGDYYYEEIAIARSLGIATGAGNSSFNPKDSISRQDMMVLAYRAMQAAGIQMVDEADNVLDQFADKSKVSTYAIAGLSTLVNEGLVSGANGKLNPLGRSTRAEAAVLLYNIYGKRYEN